MARGISSDFVQPNEVRFLMSIKLRGLVAMIAAIAGCAGVARGQDANQSVKLTPEHKALADDVGVWDAEMFVYVPDSKEPVAAGNGVETRTLLSGGLWIVSEFKGDFAAMPYEGRGQNGYDPIKAKYVSSWIDSASSRMLVQEGTYDAKTKTVTMLGDGDKLETGAPATLKTTIHKPDAENRVLSLSIKPKDGKDSEYVKFLEIRYKKRK
jgi:hypothetical protein